MANKFPLRFSDATVLMATFAVDHFEPTKRFLCLLIATGASCKPRWISIPADNDDVAERYLVATAMLTASAATLLIAMAHDAENLFQQQALRFIPAGKPQ